MLERLNEEPVTRRNQKNECGRWLFDLWCRFSVFDSSHSHQYLWIDNFGHSRQHQDCWTPITINRETNRNITNNRRIGRTNEMVKIYPKMISSSICWWWRQPESPCFLAFPKDNTPSKGPFVLSIGTNCHRIEEGGPDGHGCRHIVSILGGGNVLWLIVRIVLDANRKNLQFYVHVVQPPW